ncbi:Asp23/Gls24 family envelope stress response protein [Curtobacterium sp. ISL-83]|uniref:Asp23/Gls24 family envelope stress response protein n=1 Tax=Curtobacterium sp. ISL-83 TaxID=2819145 RepID=UPI001BE7F811|nr:Asp23/Gls24 family envelope stress response protein [Curtobacterium sp. ISL-83]MBT2503500.1 Asp23/Gls24 family envelope stress response protein [Curtobacterium sp. ISL-83]
MADTTTPTTTAATPTDATRTAAHTGTSGSTGSTGTTGTTGTTVIDDTVVAKVAGIAARDVAGVHSLGTGAARAIGAIRDAIGQRDLAQGVKVEVGEKQVAADIVIVAEYPVALQDVADGVRTGVARALQQIVGMDVAEVNVTVQDVFIPGDEDETPSRVA